MVTMSLPHQPLKMKIISLELIWPKAVQNPAQAAVPQTVALHMKVKGKPKQGSKVLFNEEDNDDYLTEVKDDGESKGKRDGDFSSDDSSDGYTLTVSTFRRRMRWWMLRKNL